jgi:serine/threonine protein kinase
MNWRLPGLRELPFLPCYAVGGRFLQFCVLRRSTDSPLLTERLDIGPLFRMDVAVDRLRIVAASFNMYRLLARLVEMLPEKAPQLYGIYERPTCTVQLFGAQIVKTCSQFAQGEVYDLLKSGQVPNSIELKSYTRQGKKLRLELQPVCVERLPQSEAELAAAVKAVLQALAAFHARGFVHRDVRWPNVLLAHGSRWLLTDFELAARAGGLVPSGAIADDFLPPEVAAAPATALYTTAGDIFCVGRLLKTSGLSLGGAAAELADQLSAATGAERPSAEQALLCPWLSGGTAGTGGGAGAVA